MPSISHAHQAAIAASRFGLGARPGDALPTDPRRWLSDQFADYQPLPAAFSALPSVSQVFREYEAARKQGDKQGKGAGRKRGKTADAAKVVAGATDNDGMKSQRQLDRKEFRQHAQQLYRSAVDARVDTALASSAPFVERMVHFWANHFCVSADNQRVAALAGVFERDAIRPHVLGSFEDMLLAVEHHPAMLIYLNQANSIGPNSLAGRGGEARRSKGKQRGLNENLGREALELHTLGVRSGYTQSDVTELARALTGWTADVDVDDGRFAFRPARHQPGPRTILGKTYPAGGETQAVTILRDLGRAPATADHIAAKLARHFVGENAPDALVHRLAASFRETKGDLPALYRTLIDSPEVWVDGPTRFKSPWEWTISCMRALGRRETGKMNVVAVMRDLGQPVWRPGSPAGWDDLDATWAAPDALIRRVEFAGRLAAPLADRLDARELAPQVLLGVLSAATAQEVARSESPADALALLLVSPEFLRR